MHTDMQLWTEVRHALFVEGISKREAVRRFGLNFRTISKIAAQEQPGEYERESPGRTKLAPYIPLIKDYLAENKTLPPKQQHTANSLSLIRFDRNDYSVPSQHAYKDFEVIGFRCAKENVDHLGYLLQLSEREFPERKARAAEAT